MSCEFNEKTVDLVRMPARRARVRWSVAAVLAAALVSGAAVHANNVTIAWDANTEPDLAGYLIGYGTMPGRNDHLVNVGLSTQWTLQGLAGGVYYFRIYAYNSIGMRSEPSQEVSTVVGTATPSAPGCPGQPPVAGWLCVNGGWVPPDSPLLTTPLPPASPSPAPTASTCAGAPPAAGWICQNGHWLPPDSPLLSAASNPQVPPASGPTLCAGSPPGAGWICQNGHWLPPDSPLLLAPSMPIVTGPAPCPGLPPGAGWLCRSGNWLPPDHPLAIGGR